MESSVNCKVMATSKQVGSESLFEFEYGTFFGTTVRVPQLVIFQFEKFTDFCYTVMYRCRRIFGVIRYF